MTERAFVALGSNSADPPARLAAALSSLHEAGERIAAAAPAVWTPYEDTAGLSVSSAPPVLNTVAELRTSRGPRDLLELLLDIERRAGRERTEGRLRTLDLDLLAQGPPRESPDPVLPHPRALKRPFVLQPWAAIAPLARVAGTPGLVVHHLAALQARRPQAFGELRGHGHLPWPGARVGRPVEVLADVAALAAWRSAVDGTVGVVPTMGALHVGHESLLRRARAECDHVLATLFVNPLQFGPGEDLERYPRTFEADLERLRASGADAVYAPDRADLYPPGFSTRITPEGPAEGLEGAARPGHFQGVATVVYKLFQRTRPDRSYFGRKDAQQIAVIRRMVADLDLAGTVVACPTVREADGLALSSRNRYLSPAGRSLALALPRTLDAVACEAVGGQTGGDELRAMGRKRLSEAGLDVEYLEIVDPSTMTPSEVGETPRLLVSTVRVEGTRLLDNRWVVGGLPRRVADPAGAHELPEDIG